jgi:type II secretory pathway pseudopilin PulG
MNLRGQGRIGACAGEQGVALVALLVALNIMAIMLTVALPVWKTAMKREKEAELVWRASQYVRAITLFQRKYANAYPPNLDILLNERFLRKKYKDPMTKDGEFQLIYANSSSDGSQTPPAGSVNPPGGTTNPQVGAARGGVIGVISKSKEASLRLFNGRNKYNEWAFTPQTVLGPRAAAPGNAPSGQIGPGGQGGPAGQRGAGTGQRGRPTPPSQPQGERRFGFPQRPPD